MYLKLIGSCQRIDTHGLVVVPTAESGQLENGNYLEDVKDSPRLRKRLGKFLPGRIDAALRNFRGTLIDQKLQPNVRLGNGLTFKQKEQPWDVHTETGLRKAPFFEDVFISGHKVEAPRKAVRDKGSSMKKSDDAIPSAQEEKQSGPKAEEDASKRRWQLELQLTERKLRLQKEIAKLKEEKSLWEEKLEQLW